MILRIFQLSLSLDIFIDIVAECSSGKRKNKDIGFKLIISYRLLFETREKSFYY